MSRRVYECMILVCWISASDRRTLYTLHMYTFFSKPRFVFLWCGRMADAGGDIKVSNDRYLHALSKDVAHWLLVSHSSDVGIKGMRRARGEVEYPRHFSRYT